MKFKAFSGIMLTLLFAGMLTLAFNIRVAGATGTIYIRADGSVEPSDAPISSVDNVTYTFTANINESIDVERDNIVVDGAGYTLQGTGATDSKGIDLTGRSNVTIKNMKIKIFNSGIYLGSSSNNTISGNNITKNKLGVDFSSSSSNTVSGNHITNNTVNGVHIWWFCYNNTVSGNNITNNYRGVLIRQSSGNTVSGNHITNNNLGVVLTSSSGNTVSGNHITNNTGNGVDLWRSNNNTFSGNNITNSEYGFYLGVSSNNVLRSNSMINNEHHFGVFGDSLSGFVNDVDASNTVDGKPIYYWVNRRDATVPLNAGYVALVNCTNITVRNLNIQKNEEAILLVCTQNSTVTQNNLTNNEFGIILFYSSNNSITNNNVTNNEDGVYLESSSNNRFYHNNFINPRQVFDASWLSPYKIHSINIWDDGYPSGGNYWSDYNGTDLYSGPYQNETGSDGIGDAPHVIYANNTDHYPLMNPWTPISWEYVFEDERRDTTLKISTDDKYFQFIAPDKTFSVKHDPDMVATAHLIFISYEDSELKLITLAVDTKLDFCFAYAKNMQTGQIYWLVDWICGDIDLDLDVDLSDFYIFAGNYLTTPPVDPLCDLDGDNDCDLSDFYVFAGNYLTS